MVSLEAEHSSRGEEEGVQEENASAHTTPWWPDKVSCYEAEESKVQNWQIIYI